MTYQHYIARPMQMIELVIIRKMNKNPELMKTIENIPHPLKMN